MLQVSSHPIIIAGSQCSWVFKKQRSPLYSNSLQCYLACSMLCMFYPANSQAISIRRNTVDLNRLCNKLGHSNGSVMFKNGWTNWLWDILSAHSILAPAIFVFFKLEELTTFSVLCSCFFLWPVCYPVRSLTHIPIPLPPTQTCHTILLAMLFFSWIELTILWIYLVY